ncbi:MAG: hypothetical protein IKU11_09245, partial [Clostridia bacterium]|nr:hypothetical protein [Clostridia bacterium]
LFLLTALFSGCGKNESTESLSFMENSSIPEGAAQSGEFYYDVTHVELTDYDEILSVIPQEDTTQFLCYNNSGSHLVTLDASYQVTSSSPTPIDRTYAFTISENQQFSIAKSTNSDGIYRFHSYLDNQVLWEYPDLGHLIPKSILTANGSVYACFIPPKHSDIWLDYDESALFINDRQVVLPEETADGKRYRVIDIMLMNDIPHALFVELSNGENQCNLYLLPLDPETTQLIPNGEPHSVSFDQIDRNAFSNSPDGMLSVIGDTIHLYTNEEYREVCNLTLFGITSSDVCGLFINDDGKLIVLQTGSVSIITQMFGSRPFREVVIGMVGELGAFSSSYDDVVQYLNYQNGPYRYRIKSYRSIENLNLAILSGEVDLICNGYESPDMFLNFVKQGILCPIDSLIPELFEDDLLLDNVISAIRIDGKCYYIPRSFSPLGLSIPVSSLGSITEFSSMDELLDFLDSVNQTVFNDTSRTTFFETLLFCGMEHWVDFENHTAAFTDGSFEKFLTLSSRCPSLISSGNGISSFHALYFSYEYTAGGDTEKGLCEKRPIIIPTDTSKHLAFHSYDSIGIVANGPNREGAIQFVQTAFTKSSPPRITGTFSGPKSHSISICSKDIASYYKSPQEQWNSFGQWLMTYATSADHIIRGDVIMDIVNEEAASYFSGHISAEKAAEYIQNRVSIYLAEQS